MGMFGNAFRPGGAGRDILGYVGDALSTIGGGRPIYGPMKMQEHQQAAELQRQMQLAQFKQANPEQPDVIRAMVAAGIDPKSPQGQAIIRNNYSHPIVLGNAENGQQIVNPAAPPQPGAGIDPAAIARLKQNPGEAAMFDEHFGPGSAAAVLGAQ